MTKGQRQRQSTHTGRVRRPDLSRFYRFKLPALRASEFEFNLQLVRPHLPALDLDRVAESFEWTEETATITGNVQLHRPDPGDPASLPIVRGQRIRCRVRWNGGWYEVWTMRVQPGEYQKDTNTLSVDLIDDMDLLSRGRRQWTFRTTKRRPHGYFAHEIAIAVARREGVALGAVAKGTVRLSKIVQTSSGLDVLRTAYAQERRHSGRKFVIRMRNGRVEIVPYRRNPLLYVLGEQIRTALLTQKPASDHPATMLTGTGHVGKGKAAKKIRHTEYRRDMVARFGFVHRTHNYGRVESMADLRAQVRRDLARSLRITNTASIQHSGNPFIRRGDGVQLALPDEGYKGAQSFVFVTRADHQVQGGSYTAGFEFTATDPFLKDRERRETEARARKRKERTRRRSG